MRQNNFMGGGPFDGARLGQITDDDVRIAYDAYNEQHQKCTRLLRAYTGCIGTKGANFESCTKMKAELTACQLVLGRLFDAWVAMRKQKAQQTSQQRAQRPGYSNYQWNRQARPISTTPTSQPTAAAGSESEVACYFCADLPGAPTYWMSAAQAAQWNSVRTAGCQKVPAKECQDKYGRAQQAMRQRFTSQSVSQYANPYGSMMTGIRVQNPELLG